jgi:hypothetical protein
MTLNCSTPHVYFLGTDFTIKSTVQLRHFASHFWHFYYEIFVYWKVSTYRLWNSALSQCQKQIIWASIVIIHIIILYLYSYLTAGYLGLQTVFFITKRKPTNRLTCVLLLSELKLEERVQILIRLVFLITKKKKKIRYYGSIRSYNSHNQAKAHLPQELHVDVLVGWLVGSLFDDPRVPRNPAWETLN